MLETVYEKQQIWPLGHYYSDVSSTNNDIFPSVNPRMPANTFTHIEKSDNYIIPAIEKLNMNVSSGKDEVSPMVV